MSLPNSSNHRKTPVPILYVVRTMDTGGLERDVAKLALGLDRARFTPHIATFMPGGLRWAELERAGIPLTNLEITSIKSPGILKSAARFARLILRNRIRLVHAYDASVVFAAPLARFLRVPVVLSAAVGSRFLLAEKFRNDVRRTDKMVDSIVVNCEAMRRELLNDFAVRPEIIDLCYNGVDVTHFHPAPGPRPDCLTGASLVIGSVCVLRPEKRLETLIEAFAKIVHLQPGLKLLIVGSGPELPKLESLASHLEVAGVCIFVPAVAEVARYLQAIDIFVSCSSSEAFSNSILEAMACGCCPVGSRVGGTPELIADGQRGLLFESGNVQDLAGKLETLITNPGLRAEFSAKAAEFAAHDLNINVALERMSEIYDQRLSLKGELV